MCVVTKNIQVKGLHFRWPQSLRIEVARVNLGVLLCVNHEYHNNWTDTLKGCPLFSRSCVSIRPFAGYISHLWPRNLYFWLEWSFGHEKETHFLFFEIFILTLFIGIFRFFSLYNTSIFCFQATGHNFSPRDMIFGLREPCTIENWRLLTFFENSIFYG